MNHILDYRNPYKTYSELRMKLSLMGIDSFPKERIFDLAKSKPNRWVSFCKIVDYYIEIGKKLDTINSYAILTMDLS